MRIIADFDGRCGGRNIWVVQERRAKGREKETAFLTEADAKIYRGLVLAKRRAPDAALQALLAEQIESMRKQAFAKFDAPEPQKEATP